MFGPQRGDVLVLIPCHDIHTAGMRRSLDVAFVDANGVVLETHRNVSKFKRLRCKGSFAVFERYADPHSDWLRAHDELDLLCTSPCDDGPSHERRVAR